MSAGIQVHVVSHPDRAQHHQAHYEHASLPPLQLHACCPTQSASMQCHQFAMQLPQPPGPRHFTFMTDAQSAMINIHQRISSPLAQPDLVPTLPGTCTVPYVRELGPQQGMLYHASMRDRKIWCQSSACLLSLIFCLILFRDTPVFTPGPGSYKAPSSFSRKPLNINGQKQGNRKAKLPIQKSQMPPSVPSKAHSYG